MVSNNLINESSPYLLQHANNPVQWYAWNDEALKKAKDENKPIFLSIGYSSCHWCHVMAHESFENNEVAEFMNQNKFYKRLTWLKVQPYSINICLPFSFN